MSHPFHNSYPFGNQSSTQRQNPLDNSGASSVTSRTSSRHPFPVSYTPPQSRAITDEDMGRSTEMRIGQPREEMRHQPVDQGPCFTSMQREFISSAARVTSSLVCSPSQRHTDFKSGTSSLDWPSYNKATEDDSSRFFSSSTSLSVLNSGGSVFNASSERERDVQPIPGLGDYDYQLQDKPVAPRDSSYPKYTSQEASDILLRFGLDKEDLEYLFAYPEDQITPGNLPFILRQIRMKKAEKVNSTIHSKPCPEPQPTTSMTGIDRFSSLRGEGTHQDKLSPIINPSKVIDYGHTNKCTGGFDDEIGRSSDSRANSGGSGSMSLVDSYEGSSRNRETLQKSTTEVKTSALVSSRDQRLIGSNDASCTKDPSKNKGQGPKVAEKMNNQKVHPKQMQQELKKQTEQQQQALKRPGMPMGQSQPTKVVPPGLPQIIPKPVNFVEMPLPPSSKQGFTDWKLSKGVPSLAMMQDYAAATPKSFPHTCSLCLKTFTCMEDWLLHQNTGLHLDNCKLLQKRYPQWDGKVLPLPSASGTEKKPSPFTSGETSQRCHPKPRHQSRSRSRSPQRRLGSDGRGPKSGSFLQSFHSSDGRREKLGSGSQSPHGPRHTRRSRSPSFSSRDDRLASFHYRSRSHERRSSPRRRDEKQPVPKRSDERRSPPRRRDDKRLPPSRSHKKPSSEERAVSQQKKLDSSTNRLAKQLLPALQSLSKQADLETVAKTLAPVLLAELAKMTSPLSSASAKSSQATPRLQKCEASSSSKPKEAVSGKPLMTSSTEQSKLPQQTSAKCGITTTQVGESTSTGKVTPLLEKPLPSRTQKSAPGKLVTQGKAVTFKPKNVSAKQMVNTVKQSNEPAEGGAALVEAKEASKPVLSNSSESSEKPLHNGDSEERGHFNDCESVVAPAEPAQVDPCTNVDVAEPIKATETVSQLTGLAPEGETSSTQVQESSVVPDDQHVVQTTSLTPSEMTKQEDFAKGAAEAKQMVNTVKQSNVPAEGGVALVEAKEASKPVVSKSSESSEKLLHNGDSEERGRFNDCESVVATAKPAQVDPCSNVDVAEPIKATETVSQLTGLAPEGETSFTQVQESTVVPEDQHVVQTTSLTSSEMTKQEDFAKGAAEAKYAEPLDSGKSSVTSLTAGEKLGTSLNKRFIKDCWSITKALSPKFQNKVLKVTCLPEYHDGCYTEEDVANLLVPFGFQYVPENIYISPKMCMAFVIMPSVKALQKLIRASMKKNIVLNKSALYFKPIKCHSMDPIVFYKFVMKKISHFKERQTDDGSAIIYIKNISPSEAADLREALKKIDSLKNFLPLLNKVFVEFNSVYDADRLGVWYSLLKRGFSHKVYRLIIPQIESTSQPPRLPANALPDRNDVADGVTVPTTNFGVPQGSTSPFWVTMTTNPFVFPTASPWFIIPEYLTVSGLDDIERARPRAASFSTVMLTRLPEEIYKPEDITRLVSRYFPGTMLIYNVIILSLQRRAFVFFNDWNACCEFVRDHIKNPISVGGRMLDAHFVLQDMHPGTSQETMYRTMMKWSNSHVADSESLEERLLCVEVTQMEIPLVTMVMEAVASIAAFVGFLPLSKRIYIEMAESCGVTQVVESIHPADRLSVNPSWRKIGRIESLKSLKQNLQDFSEITVIPELASHSDEVHKLRTIESHRTQNQDKVGVSVCKDEQNVNLEDFVDEIGEDTADKDVDRKSSSSAMKSSREKREMQSSDVSSSSKQTLTRSSKDSEAFVKSSFSSPSVESAASQDVDNSASDEVFDSEKTQTPRTSGDGSRAKEKEEPFKPSEDADQDQLLKDQDNKCTEQEAFDILDSADDQIEVEDDNLKLEPPSNQRSKADTEEEEDLFQVIDSVEDEPTITEKELDADKKEKQPQKYDDAKKADRPTRRNGPRIRTSKSEEEGNPSRKRTRTYERLNSTVEKINEAAEDTIYEIVDSLEEDSIPDAATTQMSDRRWSARKNNDKKALIEPFKKPDGQDDANYGGEVARDQTSILRRSTRGRREVSKEVVYKKDKTATRSRPTPATLKDEEATTYQILDSVDDDMGDDQPSRGQSAEESTVSKDGEQRTLELQSVCKGNRSPESSTPEGFVTVDEAGADDEEEGKNGNFVTVDELWETEEEVNKAVTTKTSGRAKKRRRQSHAVRKPTRGKQETTKDEREDEAESLPHTSPDSCLSPPDRELSAPSREGQAKIQKTQQETAGQSSMDSTSAGQQPEPECTGNQSQSGEDKQGRSSTDLKASGISEKRSKLVEPEAKPSRSPYILPPFNPNVPLGQEFVVPKWGYFCELCSVFYPTESTAKDKHCRSQRHCNNLQERQQKLRQRHSGTSRRQPHDSAAV